MTHRTFTHRAVAAGAAVVLAGLITACGTSRPAPPSESLGVVISKPDPVPDTPLVDQDGRHITLRSFYGKYVVLAQFLTLCQDECPITTGAFDILRASVRKAGLSDKVVFIEATVDPERDTVARLHAYQTEFGADWILATGTAADLAVMWKHFGIAYHKVPEDNPPGIDWWTHKPLTYDMIHTNGFILIDQTGNERFITSALPFLHGQLSDSLRSLLNDEGLGHLNNGLPGNSYTIPQALNALSWLVGRHIPLATQ